MHANRANKSILYNSHLHAHTHTHKHTHAHTHTCLPVESSHRRTHESAPLDRMYFPFFVKATECARCLCAAMVRMQLLLTASHTFTAPSLPEDTYT